MKKYILLLCLMMVAPSAMAKEYPYVGNCSVWRTNANGDMECASGGSNNNSSRNNNQQNNQNNQGGWPGNGQLMSPWQYQQVKATGRDAVNIILNSDVLASGMTADGWTRYTVRYTGDQYSSLQGVVFNCKVSPNGRQFECVNWLPPKPKQVQFGNGNWSIIFELLNKQLNKK